MALDEVTEAGASMEGAGEARESSVAPRGSLAFFGRVVGSERREVRVDPNSVAVVGRLRSVDQRSFGKQSI